MKILIAGDTHADLAHLQYLIKVAQKERCDRVFVVGDFGYWEHFEWGVRFLDQLDMYANLKNMSVYFCDGNHDKTSLIIEKYDRPEYTDPEGFLKVRPYIRYAPRGHFWTWDHVGFMSLGGAYSVDKHSRLRREEHEGVPRGTHWFPEEEITDDEMTEILLDWCDRESPTVDVVLAHDKPRGSEPGWIRRDILECVPNQQRLQYALTQLVPMRYYHGHLHWPYDDEIVYENFEGMLVRTVVEGLGCNDAGAERFQAPEQSWAILDTDEINDTRKQWHETDII